MRLGVLFSGGKDSVLALDRAVRTEEVECLITIRSSNPHSYMFHTPCIEHASTQARAMGLPHVLIDTTGEKETELQDLARAIRLAKVAHGIEGVVTGAIASMYQATRVQRVCDSLGLWCMNPLWQESQETVLRELQELGYKTMVVGVFAYPLEKDFLGRIIDDKTIQHLLKLRDEIGFNPAGEGGEIETFVLDGPTFKRPLKHTITSKKFHNHAGALTMEVDL